MEADLNQVVLGAEALADACGKPALSDPECWSGPELPHQCLLPTATATRPRMPRFTVRLPRKSLIDLEALAAADERPPAVAARVLQEAINATTASHP